jgi:outer membrane protein assembly factor BamC
MRNQAVANIVIGSLAGMLLAACSTADKSSGKSIDYKKSQTTEALEVPPDLTSSTINDAPEMLDKAGTSFTEFSDTNPAIGVANVLPDQENMRVERDGDQQWLIIQGEPQQLWPRVRDFWSKEGILIKTEDPRVGIIVTEWAENRADIPQGPIRNLIGKAIDQVYSAATRDQYRVRLENGPTPGTTELFLTHRGVEEVVSGSPEDSTTTWKSRPPDPELEAEMLKRLVVYLGVEEQRAQAMLGRQSEPKARAQLVTNDSGSLLIIAEDFSRAWRRTGVALDRVGFAVEDRNRSDGIYYVRYSDPLSSQDQEGLLSSLAFWSSGEDKEAKQYQIALVAKGRETHVAINDAEGNQENSKTATRILTLLEEQLR